MFFSIGKLYHLKCVYKKCTCFFLFHVHPAKAKTLSWERVAGQRPDGCGAARRTKFVPPLFRLGFAEPPSPRGRS